MSILQFSDVYHIPFFGYAIRLLFLLLLFYYDFTAFFFIDFEFLLSNQMCCVCIVNGLLPTISFLVCAVEPINQIISDQTRSSRTYKWIFFLHYYWCCDSPARRKNDWWWWMNAEKSIYNFYEQFNRFKCVI